MSIIMSSTTPKNIIEEQEMQCHPSCLFFCDSSSSQWEQDPVLPYLKKRITPAVFKCTYDGHIITSWYAPCPKKLEDFLKEKEKNND